MRLGSGPLCAIKADFAGMRWERDSKVLDFLKRAFYRVRDSIRG